jgi:hypothetical protein
VSDRIRRLGGAAAVALALVTGSPLPATASAQAAPADGAVTVTLEALEPRDVRPDSPITVTALLRNTGADSTGPVQVRLRRGYVLDTRGELQAAETDPPPTTAASGPPLLIEDGLTPGQARRVRYETTAADLNLSAQGVYPLGLTVQTTDTGEQLGRLDTQLPYLPDPGSGTRVALLWPLLDRPHRLAGKAEVFADDLLARSVARGGRLDGLLGAAERVPAGVRLTLLVDPETIEALDRMTAGYRVATGGGRTVAGTGVAAATAWLARLKAIAPKHLLVATPYADPDLVALQRGGNAELARFETPDLEATARVLGVAPSTKVSWPPDGQLTDEALDDVVAQGASAVVLDPTALPGQPTSGRTPSGVSPLPALSGQAVALVGDPVIERLVGAGALRKGGYPGGPRMAEQRLLAELAMVTAEAQNDSRTLLLAPPRRWNPTPAYAAAVAADLGRVSWLSSLDALQAAGGTAPVDRGSLVYPADARKRELPTKLVRTLETVRGQVADFRSALANADANAELGPYGDALRRAGSSAWRGSPAGQAYVDRLLRQIGALRGGVTVNQGATGDYTLASSDSPLLVTVENRLDVPVSVTLKLTTPAGFEVSGIGTERIAARSKRTVRVQASVKRTGTFAVRGQVVTPTGGPLGQEVTLSVRSTAYGGLALGITGLAFAVLVLAVLVRLVRRLRARGRPTEPVAAGGPGDRSRR